MRTVIQAETETLPEKFKVPYTWAKVQEGEAVQIILGDKDMTPIAIGEVSRVTNITDTRWSYEVKVTRIL